ncbi:hypothetical protein CLV30_1023 [Haloactinopolyspora alba]|uniref:Uncharacterized protein n=1 Tax=Haloactinopolyspora alba TaxID=648780 RepID=A0A2P8EAX4_9ACTN|nr:hypothetical protein [Haloactinopolyspora alba]PSL06619.1 hypothetical protein CLV30_1023 [Haloactinopolyspora alba]
MTTTLNQTTSRRAFADDRALSGVASRDMVRLLAPVDAPSTGEVRPYAPAIRIAHVGDVAKDGVRVRTWSPPV